MLRESDRACLKGTVICNTSVRPCGISIGTSFKAFSVHTTGISVLSELHYLPNQPTQIRVRFATIQHTSILRAVATIRKSYHTIRQKSKARGICYVTKDRSKLQRDHLGPGQEETTPLGFLLAQYVVMTVIRPRNIFRPFKATRLVTSRNHRLSLYFLFSAFLRFRALETPSTSFLHFLRATAASGYRL